MNTCEYLLECHPHGLVLKAPPGKSGVPLTALRDATKLGEPNWVIHPGLANALQAVAVMGAPKACEQWRTEIEAWLEQNVPELIERWLRGTDIGSSSAAIAFALSGRTNWSGMGRKGDPPHDAGDFGRCERLLNRFPEWRARLPEVAARWPDSAWPKLVPEWERLRQMNPNQVHDALRAVLDAK